MITRSNAIKRYFGTERPVETKEIMELARADINAYKEISEGCAKVLGEEIEVKN